MTSAIKAMRSVVVCTQTFSLGKALFSMSIIFTSAQLLSNGATKLEDSSIQKY
jgi:hypothetical protein